MKRTLTLILCVLLAASLLVACTPTEQNPEHTHTYANEWSTNVYGHWYAATCGCDLQKDAAAHVDADEDGVCDTCGYDADHIHAYATEWTADETNHWHASTCGHAVKADTAAHTANDAGYCSVCGAKVADVTVETIADAIKAATAQAGVVKNGAFFRHDVSEWSDYVTSATYTFADGYTYVVEDDGYSKYEYWYSPVGEDGVFCVMKVNGGAPQQNSYGVTADNIKGYAFNCDFMNVGEIYYGAEAFLAALYELASTNANGDFTESVDDGVYSFSFGVNYDNFLLSQVQVTFTLADNYMVNDISVVSDCYSSEEFTVNEETGYATLNDPWGAVASSNCEINVTQDSEKGPNPYAPEDMLATDFTLTDAEGNAIGDTVNVVAGTTLRLFIKDVVPATALPALDSFTFEYSSENYELSAMYADSYYAQVGEEYEEVVVDHIQINGRKEGTYTLTIKSTNVTKTVTVNVSFPQPEEINAEVWMDPDGWGWYSFNEVEEATAVVGSKLYINANVGNDYADGSFTAALVGDNAANATLALEDLVVSEWSGETESCYAFTATAAGTYTVELTSAVVDTIKTTLTITVEEAPELPAAEEVLNGTYSGQSIYDPTQVTVTFTPDAEGALTGTVVVEQVGYRGATSGTETFTYAYAGGVITLTHASGDELPYVAITLDEGMGLTVTVEPYGNMPGYTADIELAKA